MAFTSILVAIKVLVPYFTIGIFLTCEFRMAGAQLDQHTHSCYSCYLIKYISTFIYVLRGLPFSTYAPRGGGVKAPIHFHCVLHA